MANNLLIFRLPMASKECVGRLHMKDGLPVVISMPRRSSTVRSPADKLHNLFPPRKCPCVLRLPP